MGIFFFTTCRKSLKVREGEKKFQSLAEGNERGAERIISKYALLGGGLGSLSKQEH